MATIYSDASWTGNYTYTRVKVDYDYSSTIATATLLYTRTNSFSGSTSATGATFRFGDGSTGFSKAFYGKQTDAVVASLPFNYSLSGGTYSGSSTGGYLGGSWSVTIPAAPMWNDINAYQPDGSTQNGLTFDLRTSDGGSWTNLTNEPTNFTKPYGTTATISNIRTNIAGAHYTKNSITNDGSTSFTWTFNTPNYVVHLYSAWNTYTIAYNANGGTGAPSSQTKTYGTNLTLSSTKPTRANSTATGYTVTFNGNGGTASKASQAATDTITYTFNNWKDGAGTTYAAGGTYTKNQADTLTAQWTSSTAKGAVTTATATKSNGTSTRTVTYNANGGTCSTTSQNSTATVTYTCNGWYTATSGGTKRADSGGSYTPTASETVYAQWGSSTGAFSAITSPTPSKASTSATRTVTFNANGGTCSTASLNSTQTTTYTQNGWWTAASGGTQVVKANTSYTPSATQTVYAQYTSSVGSWSAITLPTATKSGYKFVGWNESSTATTGITGSYTPSKSVTLYAIFIPDQATAWTKSNGSWVKGKVWVKVNGTWQKAKTIQGKVSGTWKKNK